MEVTLKQFLSDPYTRRLKTIEWPDRVRQYIGHSHIHFVGELARLKTQDVHSRILSKGSWDKIERILGGFGVKLGTIIIDAPALGKKEIHDLLDQEARRHDAQRIDAEERLTRQTLIEVSRCLPAQEEPACISTTEQHLNTALLVEMRDLYARAGFEIVAGQPMPDQVKHELVHALEFARKVRALAR